MSIVQYFSEQVCECRDSKGSCDNMKRPRTLVTEHFVQTARVREWQSVFIKKK